MIPIFQEPDARHSSTRFLCTRLDYHELVDEDGLLPVVLGVMPTVMINGLMDWLVGMDRNMDGNGVVLRDGDMVLLGVDNDRGLFPLNGHGNGQWQGDGKDPLLGLEVLEEHPCPQKAFEKKLLLELTGFCQLQEEGGGHETCQT
jgi:hypothetical protein